MERKIFKNEIMSLMKSIDKVISNPKSYFGLYLTPLNLYFHTDCRTMDNVKAQYDINTFIYKRNEIICSQYERIRNIKKQWTKLNKEAKEQWQTYLWYALWITSRRFRNGLYL